MEQRAWRERKEAKNYYLIGEPTLKFHVVSLSPYCWTSWILFYFLERKLRPFIYLFWHAGSSLPCAGLLSCGDGGFSLAVERGLWGMWTSVVAAPRGGWDLTSRTRDWAHVPCIARQVLNHWATRQVPELTDHFRESFRKMLTKLWKPNILFFVKQEKFISTTLYLYI